MLDVEIVEIKGVQVVESKLLHKSLSVASYHSDWIRRRIDNYQFEEGKDYFIDNSKKSNQKGRGGDRRSKTYLLTLDMAKELCMLENNDIGKKARRYFLQAEKELRKHETIRLATKHVRRSLTDSVQDSGEQERMHGHGYGNYTKLVYLLTDLDFRYKEYSRHNKTGFRDTLTPKELKRVNIVEGMIKPLLEMEKEYQEIKSILVPLFKKKEIS